MTDVIILLVIACLYLFPTIVAGVRNKRNSGAIAALNILLGWTFIGWVVALVWSLTSDPEPQYIQVQQNAYLPHGQPEQPHSGYQPTVRQDREQGGPPMRPPTSAPPA